MTEKADIKELAIAAWRLEKWLDNLKADRKMAAKSAMRSIKKYLLASGIEIKDPIGAKFDPGLAVEVINNEAEENSEDTLIITETLSPYVYLDGVLIQHARVIIGEAIKEIKDNNEMVESVIPGKDSNTKDDTPGKAHDETIVETVPDKTFPNEEKASERDEELNISTDEIERMMAYAKIL